MPNQYIYEANGQIIHTKQYGKTTPPTITLKRPMDTDTSLWKWHQAAVLGSPTVRKDGTLTLASATSGKPKFEWSITQMWPSKLDISGVTTAGAVPMLTVTFSADEITVP